VPRQGSTEPEGDWIIGPGAGGSNALARLLAHIHMRFGWRLEPAPLQRNFAITGASAQDAEGRSARTSPAWIQHVITAGCDLLPSAHQLSGGSNLTGSRTSGGGVYEGRDVSGCLTTVCAAFELVRRAPASHWAACSTHRHRSGMAAAHDCAMEQALVVCGRALTPALTSRGTDLQSRPCSGTKMRE
jgi:hypothetical protein